MKRILLITGLLFLLIKKSKNEISSGNNTNVGTDDFFIRVSNQFINNILSVFSIDGEQINNTVRIIEYYYTAGYTNIKQLAYILATAYHESFLRPIQEIRAAPGTSVYELQNQYWNTGYYGRGFVQLTFEENYSKMSSLLNIDLVNNPELALDPDISTKILVEGMIRGVFTGKRLDQYINTIQSDYFNARRVVNGLDKAQLISNYTISFLNNLV